jgi:hypothetical protein
MNLDGRHVTSGCPAALTTSDNASSFSLRRIWTSARRCTDRVRMSYLTTRARSAAYPPHAYRFSGDADPARAVGLRQNPRGRRTASTPRTAQAGQVGWAHPAGRNLADLNPALGLQQPKTETIAASMILLGEA